MYDTPDKVEKILSTSIEKVKEPNEVHISLFVCSCFLHKKIIIKTEKAERIARILSITMQDLECAAVYAKCSGKPQVVACYKQRDVAEKKLEQLEAIGSFIGISCHSFSIS